MTAPGTADSIVYEIQSFNVTLKTKIVQDDHGYRKIHLEKMKIEKCIKRKFPTARRTEVV